ncbi:MAG: H-NS family nucleoid-associated regulatory protein [Thiotrichales bacterium]
MAGTTTAVEIVIDPEAPMASLEQFSTAQLRQLLELGQTLLDERLASERKSALEQIRYLANTYGIALELRDEEAEADAAKPRRARKPSGARYQNPENPGETWGGRGPRPKWLKLALAAGRNEQEFVVR